MQIPLELAFHGIEHSDSVEELVRERAHKLEKQFKRMVSCRVVVEAPHRDSEEEIRTARVRIDAKVPGKQLVAVSEPRDDDFAGSDVYGAVNDAFDIIERRLGDFIETRQERRDTRAY